VSQNTEPHATHVTPYTYNKQHGKWKQASYDTKSVRTSMHSNPVAHGGDVEETARRVESPETTDPVNTRRPQLVRSTVLF